MGEKDWGGSETWVTSLTIAAMRMRYYLDF